MTDDGRGAAAVRGTGLDNPTEPRPRPARDARARRGLGRPARAPGHGAVAAIRVQAILPYGTRVMIKVLVADDQALVRSGFSAIARQRRRHRGRR